MRLIGLLFCFSLGSIGAFADIIDYSWTGPDMPNPNSGPSNFTGALCPGPPYSSSCVLGQDVPPSNGDPYAIQSVQLAELTNTGAGSTWQLSITENAPFALGGFGPTAFGDFLFAWQPPTGSGLAYYGIVLGGTCADAGGFGVNTNTGVTCNSYTGHNGLTAGGLYQNPPQGSSNNSGPAYPAMYQTAGAVIGTGRLNEPVWVSANPAEMGLIGSPTGTGFSVTRDSLTPTATPAALYTITATFNAPANFLANGNFAVDVSSYVCANWLTLGPPTVVPEPRALFLIVIPVMFLLGRCLTRSRGVQVN